MASKKENKIKQDYDSLAGLWQKRFSLSKSNQAKLFKRFAEYYDVFNARVTTQAAVWRSKPYLPIVAQQVWALVAKFSSLRPGFEVRVRANDLEDDDLEEKASIAKANLEYDYDSPYLDEPMRDKIATVLIDASVTGTAIAKVPYKTETKCRYERIVDDQGIADLTKEKVTETKVGYNDFEPVNIFNVFISPATDRLNRGHLIIRDYVPISDLQKTNKNKGGKFYVNLDKLNGAPSYTEFAEYNQARNRLLNGEDQKDSTTDIATTYECYEGDMIYLFAEGQESNGTKPWVLLRKSKNYYWHGKWPIVKFNLKKRPFEFWGQGLVELTQRLQVIYNDIFAHYLDSSSLANNPSFWASEDQDVDDGVIEPGSILRYRGAKPPEPIVFNKPDPNSLTMVLGFLNQAIEGVTASQYAVGLPNSSTDKTKGTKGGIERLTDAAGDIIGYMRENLTTSILTVGKMWHSNNQQFTAQKKNIVVNDKGTRKSMEVNPADLQYETDIYLDSASMLPKTDSEKREETQGLIAGLMQLQQASMAQSQTVGTEPLIFNFNELADDIGESFGKTSVQNLIMTEDQVVEYLKEKAEKAQMQADNVEAGLPEKPDEATAQMAQELAQQGQIDPEEMMKEEQRMEMQNATVRPTSQ